MTLRRVVRFALGLVVALALGFVLFVAWSGSNAVLRPEWYEHRTPAQGLRPRDPSAASFVWHGGYRDPRADLALDYESVEIPGPGGATLRGWYVPGAPGARAGVVAVHGGGADRREFLRQVPVLHGQGYPVLLFDCREQGISDGAGRGISLGVRERDDVIAAVGWAREARGLRRVAALGTSQGGAAAILAAAADPRIDAVVAENPFTSVYELIRDFSVRPVPAWAARVVALASLWRMGGLARPAPIDAVGALAPRPLLLMHGTADVVIPVAHSERLRDAARGPVELWILEGGQHAALYDAAPDEWARRVRAFLARSIGPAAGD